eukprot:gene6287-6102_t
MSKPTGRSHVYGLDWPVLGLNGASKTPIDGGCREAVGKGDGQTNFVHLDPDTMGGCYSLITSAVAPRPIAFVSSVGDAGVLNLSPFSYFN